MGENSLGTGAARNSLDGLVYLSLWSALIKSSLTFFSVNALEGGGGFV